MRERARQLLDDLDSHHLDVDAKVGASRSPTASASRSPRRLSQNARVVIMDEPTASLAEADVQQLMAIVRGLRDTRRRHRLCQPQACRRSSRSPTA